MNTAMPTAQASPPTLQVWPLPFTERAAVSARELVRKQLDRWGMSDRAGEVTLVASELVTNGVRHGQEPVVLALHRVHHPDSEDHVRLEVWDTGCGFNTQDIRTAWDTSRSNTSESGRGLMLTDALSHSWGSARRDHHVAWACL